MPDIHQLDPTTVERIAAGEVVERPASVVKELVENSLDADASRVEVTVAAGGTEGVRVADDGVGMTEEEVRLAVEEHTTSKIRDVDDLEAGVRTLGFRGEALHAIGAVSHLTVRTRPRGGDRGTELRVEGGEVVAVEPAGCPEGTVVEVSDLFYNVPARRKYLATTATEFDHVNRVVTGYALANPDVAVSLTHGDREIFATSGRGDLQSAVMAVYGREVATAMVPVDPADDDLPAGPLDGIEGLVSHPETTRSTRDYLATFVNGRYVTSSAVREAVVDAYGTQLAPDRFPFAVLFLDLPPETVDVNIHPRKLEVRFADEAGARDQVETAVEEGLLDAGLLRSSAPRGRSAPEETEVSPERTVMESDSLAGEDRAPRRAPGRWRDETGDSSADLDIEPGDVSVDPDERNPSMAPDEDPAPGRYRAESSESGGEPSTDADAGRAATGAHDADGDAGAGATGSTDGSDAPGTDPGRRFRAAPAQTTLGGGAETAAEARDYDQLPPMRVLGQLHDTYVVAETPDGLVLVDQHAADERVNYERLRERFAGDVTTQVLAEPVELSVTAREAELFEHYRDALATLGFQAIADGDAVRVTTVPALLAEAGGPELARDLLAEFVSGDPAETVEATADALLGDMACKPSITGNTSLAEGTVVDLLAALDDCENPWACPHGRPTVVEVSETEIEERFERDYPGHQHRRPE
ncbi:MAG: DNA mismatch repair endonuclease MutL [Haloarculaceae archaeon]